MAGGEKWRFQYDPATKRQSIEWKAPDELNPKKIPFGEVKSEEIDDLL